MTSRLLPTLPTLEDLLASEPVQAVATRLKPQAVIAGVRSFLGILDREIRDAAADLRIPSPADLARQVAAWLAGGKLPVLRPVVNATGILLHPDFRLPLAEEATHALRITAAGATGYFLDAAGEQRLDDEEALSALLARLTGCEAAWAAPSFPLAVHACAALAAGKEVVVARGEVVDDGDCDLAAIIAGAGARLREIGAANRATASDYEQAITRETGLVLRFRPRGAAEDACKASLAELAALARSAGVPLADVQSGGGLIELAGVLPPGTPSVAGSLQAGADLVLLRGDDLLGGPPCGLVAGRRAFVAPIRQQAIARLAPLSPLVAAGLFATLALYDDPARVRHRIPLLELLTASVDNLKNRAERIAPQLAACPGIAEVVAIELEGHLRPASAGAAVPMPGWGVAMRPREGVSAAGLQQQLLAGPIKVVATVAGEKILINLRSLPARQDQDIIAALEPALANHP